MKSPVKSIVIVGGGSSGWMSAAMFATRFPELKITLVESPDVPIIGVGESTLGSINLYLSLLGLKDTDWMEYCNATYKLSIKFRDFYKKGETFYYPFGTKDVQNTQNRLMDWFYKKVLNPDTPITDFYDSYYSVMPLIYDNKICDNTDVKLKNFNFENDAAYHMDATLFGEYIKENICKPKGVIHIVDHVENFVLGSDGYLERIELRSGNNVTGDLYVDCTGFKSLLLEKTMGVPFQSYEDWLPNNRAWTTHVPYTDKEVEMENVTNCTAIDNGWVWNIPLYNRIGSGYVFSNKFISEEDALQEYKGYLDSSRMTVHNPSRSQELSFRLIEIKNGQHDVCWKNNVVGVGLAYAFVEPLESTGLLTVQEMVLAICEMLSNEQISRVHVDHFNFFAHHLMDGFKSFVAYHFTPSSRRDTPYWQHVTQNIVMEPRLSDKKLCDIETIDRTYSRCFTETHHLDDKMGGFPDIFVGMHMFPANKLSLDWFQYGNRVWNGAEQEVFSPNTQLYWNFKKNASQSVANKSPSHYQYLKEHIYKNKP